MYCNPRQLTSKLYSTSYLYAYYAQWNEDIGALSLEYINKPTLEMLVKGSEEAGIEREFEKEEGNFLPDLGRKKRLGREGES